MRVFQWKIFEGSLCAWIQLCRQEELIVSIFGGYNGGTSLGLVKINREVVADVRLDRLQIRFLFRSLYLPFQRVFFMISSMIRDTENKT